LITEIFVVSEKLLIDWIWQVSTWVE